VSGALGGNVWVFHSGALGDHVMIWPLVRAMTRQGTRVTVVTASSHARLCEREVGGPLRSEGAGIVVGLSVESARYTGMWAGRAAVGAEVVRDVGVVLSFVADEESESGRRWMESARTMFPGARIACVGAPGTASRRALWNVARVEEQGGVTPQTRTDGGIHLFVGAGGAAKKWPLERWVELAARLRDERIGGLTRIVLLGGPVEREQMSAAEREVMDRAGMISWDAEGEFGFLVQRARSSRVFVGADTGPTHLAAQLGVPTIALFGPTDPHVWRPVGPRVEVLTPDSPRGMEWLDVERVLASIRQMLESRGG
jgi:hypothetical protein